MTIENFIDLEIHELLLTLDDMFYEIINKNDNLEDRLQYLNRYDRLSCLIRLALDQKAVGLEKFSWKYAYDQGQLSKQAIVWFKDYLIKDGVQLNEDDRNAGNEFDKQMGTNG